MKKLLWLSVLLAMVSSGHADQTGYTPVAIESSALFSKDVAVFYPGNTNRDTLPPSFALLSEPRPVGAVPASWKVKPRFESNGASLRFTIPVAEGTSLYGTGEVVGPLERTGRQVTLWNTDNYLYKKDKGQRLYQSHPWILAVREDGSSFGVLADTTYESHIDLRDDGIHFSSDAPGFRVMVIEKQSPQDVIMELGKLTGTMEMPPLWALGYQQCRFSYFPDKRVREIADTFRAKKIP
ncbi:MAG: TIM-barrel domain-containing protein, partial [Kiritimatiellia bacterium]